MMIVEATAATNIRAMNTIIAPIPIEPSSETNIRSPTIATILRGGLELQITHISLFGEWNLFLAMFHLLSFIALLLVLLVFWMLASAVGHKQRYPFDASQMPGLHL